MANHPNRGKLAKIKHYVVRAASYNGHKNVLFMMKADDYRLGTPNYQIVAPGVYNHKERTIAAGEWTYQVFNDWSLRPNAKIAA